VEPVRIVVVGSLNMDMIVETPRIALAGETIIGGSFSTLPGGKGANQAVATSRLGAEVHLVGCVGDDDFGRQLLVHLDDENVNTEYVTTVSDVLSGVAFVTVNESGENSIVVSPGANARVTPSHIRQAEEVIRSADLLLIQLEIPIDAVEEAVKLAKYHQVRVILNPAPASHLPERLLQEIDILTPNETEGKLIATGQADSKVQLDEIIPQLLSQGVKNVVMTLGEKGVVYSVGESVRYMKADKVKVVDTTGAGDTFNAGLAVYLAEGYTLEQAVCFGQKTAALSVANFGAQSSMPSRKEVEVFSK
jgi:ribokinase